jgi:hypothetical protein
MLSRTLEAHEAIMMKARELVEPVDALSSTTPEVYISAGGRRRSGARQAVRARSLWISPGE